MPLIPKLKGKWATASGTSGTLSDAPIDLKAGDAGEWFAHRGFRINIPQGATITWPALPHNPYAKDGKPKYCYNFFGMERYYVEGTKAIPPGQHQVRFEFAYDGGGLGKGGTNSVSLPTGAPVNSAGT